MSTVKFPLNGIDYDIGTIGTEYFKSEGFFSFFKDISTNMGNVKDVAVFTYGLWAGPGYAGGKRPLNNADIEWDLDPCMNDSITKPGANPEQCFSLVDAITKTHDFRYTEAEEIAKTGDKARATQLQITADLIMFQDIITALKTGVYNCPALTFTSGETVYTLQQRTYTQILEAGETSYFDSAEIEYAKLLAPAFVIKMECSDRASEAQIADAYKYEKEIKRLIGVDLTITDPNDSTKTTKIEAQSNGILYEISDGTTKFAWVIDDNAQKTYEAGKVEGSAVSGVEFYYEGGGKISITGSSADNKIYTGENDEATYYELNGGAGYDTYYLTDGDSFIINDSGANRIYKKDADGGWMTAGDFYKDAAAANWKNADGDMLIQDLNYWTLTFEDGSTIQFAETFQSGDFGINLLTIPSNPVINNTYLGDYAFLDFDPTGQSIKYMSDAFGNLYRDLDKPAPNKSDYFNDTPMNDKIITQGGGDYVWMKYGGNDWILCGLGKDNVRYIDSIYDNIIEGGGGGDLLLGGSGNDKIFCEDYGEMENLIAEGDAATGIIDTDGDVAYGGGGNDYIYGANNHSLLVGGMGNDLLVGGGGDDFIYGDGVITDDFIYGGLGVITDDYYTFAWGNWSYTMDVLPSGNSYVYYFEITGFSGTLSDLVNGDDDVIYAGTGNDVAIGNAGDDEIYGGGGMDTLFGDAGNDFIEGGDDNDVIKGDSIDVPMELHGNDYIDGGNGADIIWGNSGNDNMFGGDDNDILYGDDGDDYLDGEAGMNTLYGGAGNDDMFGGDEADLMEGDYKDAAQGNDYLDGLGGNDTISGIGGADTLFGGDGNDQLHGDAENVALAEQGDDYIDGEGGDDYIVGYAGNDYLDGGEDNNTLYGGDGDDEIIAGTGHDYIRGDAGIDYIDAGDGNNIVLGGEGDDKIFAGAGVDWLQGDTGNDYLDGGEGNSTLLGGDGNDELFGGGDIDYLQGDAGDDYLDGFAANDMLLGGDGSDTLFGSDGNDHLQGDIGDDYLDGGAGLDSIWGGAGNDSIYGGEGNDQITGEADDDYIEGGGGNDYLEGGDGNDVIYAGDLDDTLWGGGGNDSLFGESHRDHIYGEAGDDYIDGGDDDDYIDGGAGSDAIYGGAGNDSISGGAGSDYIDGGIGDDSLYGNERDTLAGGGSSDTYLIDGSDVVITDLDYATTDYVQSSVNFALPAYVEMLTLTGEGDTNGSGNDYGNTIKGNVGRNAISGAGGDDLVHAGAGDDQIFGDTGNDYLYGGSDDDAINGGDGNDQIYGGSGRNTLIGGAGNDSMEGGCGGWYTAFAGDPLMSADTGVNIMSGGLGDDYYVIYSPDDVVIENANEGNYDQVRNFIHAYTLPDNVETLRLTGDNAFNGTGNGQNNQIFGNNNANILEGGAGGDWIYSSGGDDTMSGGIHDASPGYESYDYLCGGDYYYGFANGSWGEVWYDNFNGNDTYLFGRGSGQDIIYDRDATAGNVDTILLGSGISTADIIVRRERYTSMSDTADHLILSIAGAGDSIKVQNWFDESNTWKVENIRFADGTIWDVSDIAQRLLEPTEGNDILVGGDGDDYMRGAGGDDEIYDGEGNDTIDGGAGSDTIFGGLGADVYLFGRGYGKDYISEDNSYADPTQGSDDTILFSAGIMPGDIMLTKNEYGALVISVVGTSDSITVSMNVDGSWQIGNIQFADGTFWDMRTINNILALQGTAGDDTLTGFSTSDRMYGYAGNDVLYGREGNDTLDGGTGADTLIGEAGNETFIVDNTGDVITENTNEGTDSVQSSVTYALAANVENLILTETTAINGTGNILNNYLIGNSAINTLTGGAGNDTLDGGAGKDTLIGGTGNDTYVFARGYGQDTINDYDATSGNVDTIFLGNGIATTDVTVSRSGDNLVLAITGTTDTLNVQNWFLANYLVEQIQFANGAIWDQTIIQSKLTVIGTSGNDNLTGTSGADLLSGLAGNDTLTGLAGNDTLDGGTGADKLIGGAGNDIYIIDNTGDVITENANEGTDSVQSSVTYALAANVENLTLTGTTAINATGNTLDNYLTGNSAINTLTGGAGNDTLDGKGGADKLIGGAGNDTYIVDNTGDVITEALSAGTDSVQSSVTYTIAANVENLILLNTTAINGTGNTLANYLTGNSAINTLTGLAGDDTLDGKGGADKLTGGAGNDTYIVDNTGDVITENASEGTDTVKSSVTYTLATNVENLTLLNTSAINGTGNTSANALTGNSAINTLTGLAGNDTIDGGAGNDSLVGGTGNDAYLFRRTDGQDTINDYSTTTTDVDTLKLTDGITSTEPVIVKQNGDLYVFVNGTNYVKIASQFSATTYGIERLEVSDGHYVSRQDIESIVNTMSSINNNAGLDVMQKYNAMMADQTYISTLAQTWKHM